MCVGENNKGTSKAGTAGVKGIKRNTVGKKSPRFTKVSMKIFHSVLLEAGVKQKDLVKGMKLSVQGKEPLFNGSRAQIELI